MVTTFHLFGHLGLSSGVHGCKKASTVLLLHHTAPIPMETCWPPTTRSIRHHERGILSLSAGCSRGSLGFRVTKSWQKIYDGPNIKGCLPIQLPLIFEIWSFEHGSSLLHIAPAFQPWRCQSCRPGRCADWPRERGMSYFWPGHFQVE